MDKGAHFYRCDFQVHSPRDRNWNGKQIGVNPDALEALTAEQEKQITDDRVQFAKEYLFKARSAGLNAIAITDHHDVVSAKLIKEVAKEENKAFIANSQFEKIITIFPGIELTLANPASQCLLIFDADFSDASLDSVINFLGITPTNEFEKSTAETERISQEIIKDLVHLHKKLDELAYCRGHYIILPHVGKDGQDSILRRGFQEHYRKMPCVGGYVDRAISSDSGYQNKINGGDVHYGNKSIAVISTSDNRFEDGREFGKYSTWIKWAEPTAEALRQACLAKESRISQKEPELPQIYIKSIDVTTSKFLGTFNINLNKQYNALIGGRGTGKSTILEYLRWGLCDQTIQNVDYEDLTVIERRRNALIQKTLVDVNGEVRITMEKNGIIHVVKRNSGREILLKIGEDEFQQVKEEDIRKLLPIQSYSQKQLSDVGVKTEELKRFIEQPILSQLDTLKFQLSETGTKLKSSYNQLIRKKEIEQEINNFTLQFQSLNIQVDNIRKSLKGISDADKETINKKSKYEIEQSIINNSIKELSVVENKADELLKLLELYPEPLRKVDETENKQLIQNISSEVETKFVEIKTAATTLKNIFCAESLNKLNAMLDEWRLKKESFEVAYDVAKSKSQSSKQQLHEIQQIEKEISGINKEVSDKKSLIKEIGNFENDFNIQRQNWVKFHTDKVLLLNEQAKQFTQLSNNLIKAEVTKSINFQPFKMQLKNIFEGTRIREEKIDAIIEHIKQSNEPIKEYISVLEEFRLLVELKVSEDKTLKIPDTPILTSCKFTEEQKSKLCSKISTDDWLRLSTNELEFNPEFYYKTNNKLGDVIPFAAASAGQQATALLTVLLNQSGIPLLIDQPEDDIDNRAIDQIIKNIWDAKKKRQLVFTSHNANLVVNGDAELVICCDYKDSTSQTRGILKEEGAIDKKAVRNEITSVMEGGEKAFRLRKDKYGF
ncbi:MAG TPA: AAA family ATPase [Candidatus Methanoperedens sp.]